MCGIWGDMVHMGSCRVIWCMMVMGHGDGSWLSVMAMVHEVRCMAFGDGAWCMVHSAWCMG